MNWSEFFAMGGYATYVWSSFGLMAFVLLLNLGMTLRKKADAETKARHYVTREKK